MARQRVQDGLAGHDDVSFTLLHHLICLSLCSYRRGEKVSVYLFVRVCKTCINIFDYTSNYTYPVLCFFTNLLNDIHTILESTFVPL